MVPVYSLHIVWLFYRYSVHWYSGNMFKNLIRNSLENSISNSTKNISKQYEAEVFQESIRNLSKYCFLHSFKNYCKILFKRIFLGLFFRYFPRNFSRNSFYHSIQEVDFLNGWFLNLFRIPAGIPWRLLKDSTKKISSYIYFPKVLLLFF